MNKYAEKHGPIADWADRRQEHKAGMQRVRRMTDFGRTMASILKLAAALALAAGAWLIYENAPYISRVIYWAVTGQY